MGDIEDLMKYYTRAIILNSKILILILIDVDYIFWEENKRPLKIIDYTKAIEVNP